MIRTLLVILLISVPLAIAENHNIAHVRPTAVVPLMKTAPTIDGVIGEDEWPTLHVARFVSQKGDQLSARPGEFWVGSDGESLFIAVRSAVHPQAGVLAKHLPQGERDVSEVIYDDSLELWIDNQPEGATGQYYQIMVNSLGTLSDASFERRDKIAQRFWRVNLRQAHTVTNGMWTAEFAIPLAELNIADPNQPLAMRVCRNYKLPWDQARWAPRVRAFDTPDTMPRVRFADMAPVVSELGFQDDQGIRIAVALTNPGVQPLPVTVRLGYNPQDQPRYYKTEQATLAPGATKTFVYAQPFFTPDNYPAIGEILVTGADGTIYYHRDFRWETKPKDPWDPVVPASTVEATDFRIAYYPSYRRLRWQTDFARAMDRGEICEARVTVRHGDTVVARDAQPVANFTGEGDIALPTLADGDYVVELFLNGTNLVKTTTFTHRSDFPWLNNDIGRSQDVIPPFTPMTVQGRTVGTILREHTLSDEGLWAQVRTAGEEILAAPMRFEPPAAGQVKIVEAQPHRVVAVAEWRSGKLTGTTTSEFDYDGCMKVTLELTGESDALDLVVPLRDAAAPLMHVCAEGLRSNYGGRVPAGDGEVWTSARASRDKLLGTFLPYLFVGGEERGLVWFASNDRDWVPGEKPLLALERHGETLTLRVRLIQGPVTLARPHRIVFGLQATPVKPMPAEPDWRLRGFVSGGQHETHVLGMSMYWGADLYSIFPRGRDFTVVEKIAAARKRGERDDAFFQEYVARYPDIRNEINWSATPAKADAVIPYTNLRGEIMTTPEWLVYQDEWRRVYFPEWRHTESPQTGSIDFAMTPVRSRQDYLLYYYRELLRRGFDGIYWDNICIYANENPVTGNGYRRADGLWQTDTDIWLLRELTKRTAVMFHQEGKRNLTMPHMTNAYLLPVFAWTTLNLDWEWKYGGTDFQERFTRDYIRAASLGRQGGNIPVILPGITEVHDPVRQAWVERTRIAVCLPHEINIWQADPLFVKIKQYLYDLGYGRDAEVYNYWERQPVATITGADAVFLVVRGRTETALLIANWGDTAPVTVTLDCEKLGLPREGEARNWENPAEAFPLRAGQFTLPNLPRHDFRLLRIR